MVEHAAGRDAGVDVQPFILAIAIKSAWRCQRFGLVSGGRQSERQKYGHLDGSEGVQITRRQGFEVDSLEIKARLDSGCGRAAQVGGVKSTGVD